MPDVLVNFDQNSNTHVGRLLNDIVRISYALHLALVFPIMNYSLRINIDELIFSNKNKPPLASDTPRFVSLTLSLLALTYLVAVAIPNIWYFFQFLGSTTVVCTSFIFPAAIVLRYICYYQSICPALYISITLLNLYIHWCFLFVQRDGKTELFVSHSSLLNAGTCMAYQRQKIESLQFRSLFLLLGQAELLYGPTWIQKMVNDYN